MQPGPKALLYQNTLFRTSELVWLKVAPLTPLRQGIRWAMVAAGLLFFYFVASSKGGYRNIEGLLGLLVWHVGFCLHNQVRLGSSGDLQESYESRGGGGSTGTFRQWFNALSEGPNEFKVSGKHYQYWFNLDRVAWAGPCWLVDWYPLVLPPVFLFYRWLILRDFQLGDTPILREVSFLSFANSTSSVLLMCWVIALLGVAAFAASLSAGVEVRASGGVGDQFAMSAAERDSLLQNLAGNVAATAPAPVVAAVPTPPAPVASTPPEVSAPTPAP